MQKWPRKPPLWGGAARAARRCPWLARRRPPRLRVALPCCGLPLTFVLLIQENVSYRFGLAPRRHFGPPRAAPCDRPWCRRGPVRGRPESRQLTKARALSDEELVGLGQGDAEAGPGRGDGRRGAPLA